LEGRGGEQEMQLDLNVAEVPPLVEMEASDSGSSALNASEAASAGDAPAPVEGSSSMLAVLEFSILIWSDSDAADVDEDEDATPSSAKKSHHDPRSHSSQYRGVTFYRRNDLTLSCSVVTCLLGGDLSGGR
jgi:hypothetical protein